MDCAVVCIPKLELPQTDLLGATAGTPTSLLWRFLTQYVEQSNGSAAFYAPSGAPGMMGTYCDSTATYIPMKLPKCDLTIWATNEKLFALKWIERTGSTEHYLWLHRHAEKIGGKIDPLYGLFIGGKFVETKTEEAFYAALGLPFIEPRNRLGPV